jgi:uncharacterized membrane protein YfcA
MEFAASGVSISPWIPPLVAFLISLFTSMGGVSGAFLLLPFQMSILGFTSPAVSSTNHLYNVVSIPSGVLRFIREDRMLWPLTWVVIAGTLPGVVVGVWVRVWLLPDPSAFKVFAGFVLLLIGSKMAHEVLKARERRVKAIADEPAAEMFKVTVRRFGLKRVVYSFDENSYSFSTPVAFVVSLIVGTVGGVYGIGGGAIIAPFFVAFLRLPVHTVAGAALMGTFVTSIVGVVAFQLVAPLAPSLAVAPDWKLGLLFGLGGAVGMYCGARLQRFVPARAIKIMLALVVVFTAIRYLVG